MPEDKKKDYELKCHSNNAFPVLRIEGTVTIRGRGKIVALNSSGDETLLYENLTDRDQTINADSGNIVVIAA